jgi:hypothetical protein
VAGAAQQARARHVHRAGLPVERPALLAAAGLSRDQRAEAVALAPAVDVARLGDREHGARLFAQRQLDAAVDGGGGAQRRGRLQRDDPFRLGPAGGDDGVDGV